jgi:hypothetical protein
LSRFCLFKFPYHWGIPVAERLGNPDLRAFAEKPAGEGGLPCWQSPLFGRPHSSMGVAPHGASPSAGSTYGTPLGGMGVEPSRWVVYWGTAYGGQERRHICPVRQ